MKMIIGMFFTREWIYNCRSQFCLVFSPKLWAVGLHTDQSVLAEGCRVGLAVCKFNSSWIC